MEKFLKMGWSDIIKIVLIIGSIATAWGIQQAKIADLSHGREENRQKIELLSERMRLQEIQISSINEKLNQIGNDVTVIKNAVLSNAFDGL